MAARSEQSDDDPDDHRREEPPVLEPNEARQGQIILGPWGRRIWLTTLVVFILAVLASGVVAYL